MMTLGEWVKQNNPSTPLHFNETTMQYEATDSQSKRHACSVTEVLKIAVYFYEKYGKEWSEEQGRPFTLTDAWENALGHIALKWGVPPKEGASHE